MTTNSYAPRILIIGPVPPLRGGIALHTGRLAQALMQRGTVRVQSFSRLYPSNLFPGSSTTDPDTDMNRRGAPDTSYRIDALNPFSWSRAIKDACAFSPDFAMIPWWTVYVFPCLWSLGRGLRRAGIPLVLMCHNILDHEHSVWKRPLSHLVMGTGDLHIVHSVSDRAELLSVLPNANVKVHPHPIYDHYPSAAHRLPQRSRVELLFYGFIRNYKGLHILLEAMALLRDVDLRLSVVGEFWIDERIVHRQIERLGIAGRVELVPRYVNEADAASYFERADAVVLPYLAATGSGVASLAYHYGKPVIASRVGGLTDYVIDEHTGLFAEPGDAHSLAATLRRFSIKDNARWSAGIAEFRQSVSWERMAELILEEGLRCRRIR